MFNHNIGTSEIIILAIVLLVFFGPRKIPELMKGISQAIKEIKKGLRDASDKS